VAELASLNVIRASPTASRRIRNRQIARLLLQLECYFVEEDPARLREVANVEGKGVTYTINDGEISTHLPSLLESAKGIPLFTYLDPCGLISPLDQVASIF
jgi:hypothetical protein